MYEGSKEVYVAPRVQISLLFFLLVLFTRGGRKSGESPGFDFKFRKEFQPVSVEESDRRARGGREEGGLRLPRVAERPKRGERVAEKRAGGERHEKN